MENNIRRKSKNIIKLNLLLALTVIAVMLTGIGVYYCKNFYEMQKEERNININVGYDEEDIESIEELRGFFECYSEIEEYGIDAYWWRHTTHKYDNILNESINLLRKYGEIKLDEDKTLVYDKEKRNMKITQEGFTLDTEFNVDIYSSFNNYWNIISTIETEKGTWAKVDTGIAKYVLYLLGNAIDEIEINNVSGLLTMIDLKEINEYVSYKSDTKYYLFEYTSREYYKDYYIYRIEKNEWIKFSSISEIDITDDFISFIDSDNNFYVYCIEHNSKIFVETLKEKEELINTYSIDVKLPRSIESEEELVQKLFKNHKNCE